MSVDPAKPRKVLVVHGVQTGDDAGLDNDERVTQLIDRRLGNTPLAFTCEMYRYEDVNDASQRAFKRLIGFIIGTPFGSFLSQKALDLVGDVAINLAAGSTAAHIRNGLRNRILEIYEAGNPCYVVAHSLGSIYAFDVINELIREGDGLFDRRSRRTWPVQAFVTIGSPIGLGMFRVAGRRVIARMGVGEKWFKWLNYWDRTDPVVSGHIFGTRLNGFDVAERFTSDDARQGWVIRDIGVDTGKAWLLAHVAYWDSPVFGDGLFNVLSN